MGHRDMRTTKTGRRYCGTCAAERQRRYEMKRTLDRMEEERRKALDRIRELDPKSATREALERFVQRTEDSINRLEAGTPLPRQHRKWIARVNRHDGLLCPACEARVFPWPRDSPSVEECPQT
jgi:hypothetical protein